jgi:hypothetical protein
MPLLARNPDDLCGSPSCFLRDQPIILLQTSKRFSPRSTIMSISSVSPKSPLMSFSTASAGIGSNATAIQSQITALQKRIQAEKISKSDDAKARATKLAQYNLQLQQLDAQLANLTSKK